MSHLQFANDTIFFFRVSLEDVQNLKLILLVYERLRSILARALLVSTRVKDQISRLALVLECVVFD